jgi:uncharacterized protein Smg (DUF494 family)
MSKIRDDMGRLEDLEEISSYLKNQGFTESEISSAYSWLLNRLQQDSEFLYNAEYNRMGTRILSETERRLFTPPAYGYILQLQHLGLLNEEQLEQVLERGAMIWSSPVGVDQLKTLIDSVLFYDNRAIEISGDASQYILDENETVN